MGICMLYLLTWKNIHSLSKYVRGTRIRFQFIDSFRFLNTSLENIASFLSDDQKKTLRSEFPNKTDYDLLLLKGVCTYEYVDAREKLNERKIPEKKYFYSSLTDSHITDQEFFGAQHIWNRFNCRTIKDYYMLYLHTDVILICNVFEKFRDEMMKHFNLDPTCYISLPGFTFDTALKYTRVSLEPLTDIDHLMFFERGIRGVVYGKY